jgi:predicted nuclease of predicted toxin-antitoxin system
MKFLVDAHLPRRLAFWLRHAGYDAVHTLDLPNKNRTTDDEINNISIQEQRIVITKDGDFVDSFFIKGKPYKLLLVSTGNITNAQLESKFVPTIPAIVTAFTMHGYVELSRTALIIHV